MKYILIYWTLTTIYGVYWLIKHPSERHIGEPYNDHFTLLEVVAFILPAGLLAWAVVPMMLLNEIKFKRQ